MPDDPGASRARSPLSERLAWVAALLVAAPLVVEGAALDPATFAGRAEAGFAALRLALLGSLPYFAAAVSVAALALAVRDRPLPAPRPSPGLLLAAAFVAVAAATTTTPMRELFGAGGATVAGATVRFGGGGVLARAVPAEPIPLEEAGGLAAVDVPARPGPEEVTVRWLAWRNEEIPAEGTTVELIAAGSVRDVTDEYRALPVGEGRVLTRALRVGPSPAQVRLRLSHGPRPPVDFFDAARSLDVAGLALVAGGGDQAFQVASAAGPGLPADPGLSVTGTHVEGGHTVLVVSGEAWSRHDLSGLLADAGVLEIRTAGAAGGWSVRLVGDGAESSLVPLSGADGVHSIELSAFDLGALSSRQVVGVALSWQGPPGETALTLTRVRATVPAGRRSGFALGTLGALDPGARPAQALLAVEAPLAWPARHGFALRVVAAVLAVVGGVGLAGARSLATGARLATPAALACGPLLAATLAPLLTVAAAPRAEHLPLALAALALVLAGAAALPWPAAPPRASLPPWTEAALGAAVLGAVATHVTADAAGAFWPDASFEERLLPALVRWVATPLDYPLLLVAGLSVLVLERRPAWRRLLVAFLLWSALYLLIRQGKALAFGYEEALRAEVARARSWLGYVTLGTAQYHLFVLPVLLVLGPVAAAVRHARPAFGLLLLATLVAWPLLDRLAWLRVPAPEDRAFALRGTMLLGLAGYCFLLPAIEALQARDSRRRLLVGAGAVLALALGRVAVDAWSAASTGTWPAPDVSAHLARYVAPAAVWTALRSGLPTAGALRALGSLGFGVWLVHPAVLDVAEVFERGGALGPTGTVLLNLVVVTGGSVAVATVLARSLRGLTP